MPDVKEVINKVTTIVADMQEEVDEWKDYSDSELRSGLTCDCDWWYKTLQTLKDAIALLKAQEPVEPTEPDEENMRYCGACGSPVGYEALEAPGIEYVQYSYCPNCGRKVKYE